MRPKKKRGSVEQSKPNHMDALHEAAHAVVAVRAGLPLAFTDLRQGRPIEHLGKREGRACVSRGYTALVVGSAQGWADALPDPDAKESLVRSAAMWAAGMVAEVELRDALINDDACAGDFQAVIQTAAVLGIGDLAGKSEWAHNTEDDVWHFMVASLDAASGYLSQDGRAAWERVADALFRKKRLSGDEVRRIVADCDG